MQMSMQNVDNVISPFVFGATVSKARLTIERDARAVAMVKSKFMEISSKHCVCTNSFLSQYKQIKTK